MFPKPELERSVAIEPELSRSISIHPQRKASLSELEQMVKEFRREKDYSSAMLVMDTIDGLKPTRESDYGSKMNKMVMEEREAMERDEIRNMPSTIDQELEYIRNYGIEWFLLNYENRVFEGLTCLRDVRYLNAQLSHLKEFE